MASAITKNVQIVISGPSMAAAMTLARSETGDHYGIWLGKEVTTRSSVITDEQYDEAKEETFIVLQMCRAINPDSLDDRSSFVGNLPKNSKLVGLTRFKDTTESKTKVSAELIRELMDIVGTDSFVYTIFAKDGKATTVTNTYIPRVAADAKFVNERKVLRVINLADEDSKLSHEVTGSLNQWIPEPKVPGFQVVNFVFTELRNQLEEMAKTLSEKATMKDELQKQIKMLEAKLEAAKIRKRDSSNFETDPRSSSSFLKCKISGDASDSQVKESRKRLEEEKVGKRDSGDSETDARSSSSFLKYKLSEDAPGAACASQLEESKVGKIIYSDSDSDERTSSPFLQGKPSQDAFVAPSDSQEGGEANAPSTPTSQRIRKISSESELPTPRSGAKRTKLSLNSGHRTRENLSSPGPPMITGYVRKIVPKTSSGRAIQKKDGRTIKEMFAQNKKPTAESLSSQDMFAEYSNSQVSIIEGSVSQDPLIMKEIEDVLQSDEPKSDNEGRRSPII